MSGKAMSEIRYDLCVVGAGSGGIGAALAAARMGLSVLLIENPPPSAEIAP